MFEKKLLKTLLKHKHQTFFIGGYVRDKLLGIKSSDVDIVTSATPDEIIDIFKDTHKVDIVGQSFGVVLVNNVEIATFRKDFASGLDARNTKVKFDATLKEDTERRDFTINTLAETLDGKIIDFHNGITDLENKIIRFVGNSKERIWEDPNRMLRAARFVAKINGHLANDTLKAMKESKHLFKHIAKERIRMEVLKAMKAKKPSLFFETLHEIDLLEEIFPALDSHFGIPHDSPWHDEGLWEHMMMSGDSVSSKFPVVRLATFLHDVGKLSVKEPKGDGFFRFHGHEKVGEEILLEELKELKFSNKEIKIISGLARFHMSFIKDTNDITKKQVRKLMNKIKDKPFDIKDILRVIIGDRNGVIGKHRKTKLENFKFMKTILTLVNEIKNKQEPFALKDMNITGREVMELLNIKSSPKVGMILNKLFEEIIENPEFNENEILRKKVLDCK